MLAEDTEHMCNHITELIQIVTKLIIGAIAGTLILLTEEKDTKGIK